LKVRERQAPSTPSFLKAQLMATKTRLDEQEVYQRVQEEDISASLPPALDTNLAPSNA
jgi:hypothetical protein